MSSTTAPAVSNQDKLLRARRGASEVARLSTAEKNALLGTLAHAINSRLEFILAANRRDVEALPQQSTTRDRLLLNEERMRTITRGVHEVVGLPDPVGETLAQWVRPNGLRIRKFRVPLGVLGVIYESRPNVTVDTVALALKAGNAIVLRGGREAVYSNKALVEIIAGLPGMPEGAVELLDSSSRQSVEELIKARGLVDVIIPRGGPELINHVVQNSCVPVIETGAGNCHIFVDESADSAMADRIILNAKTQRPSVCNAAEKLLIHEKIAPQYIPRIVARLREAGVEVRGDARTLELSNGVSVAAADPQDWGEEYLRLCIAIAVVSGVKAAIEHINHYSSRHSEAIITRDEEHAREFLRDVDSAVVYWNASTRFSDGGEFGFGAEMGISTQKLHCRGPFGLPELTTVKYQVVGSGQVRS